MKFTAVNVLGKDNPAPEFTAVNYRHCVVVVVVVVVEGRERGEF